MSFVSKAFDASLCMIKFLWGREGWWMGKKVAVKDASIGVVESGVIKGPF